VVDADGGVMDVVSAVEGGGEVTVTDETIEVVVESEEEFEVGEIIVDSSETGALPVALMMTTVEG